MHYLREVSIKNFRSCNSCTIPLSKYTPIVGYNNGGKSNIIDAIRWLLRRWALSESDFNQSNEAVIVTGVIDGVSDEVLAGIDKRHRTRIEPLIVDGRIHIRRVQHQPGGGVGAIELHVFDQSASQWRENPTGIDAAINALFPEPIHIPAMADAAEDVAKAKTSTTIGKLLAELTAPVAEQHGPAIQAALDQIRSILEAGGTDRAPELVEFDEQANAVLQAFFPGVRVKVHIPSPDLVDLFKGGTIRVFEGIETDGREVSSMGHGTQRSIQMALVRYLAERKATGVEGAATTLLLIDEPELYLHPTGIEMVRNALESLSMSGYQVIFSTHAPQMVPMDSIADTLIVRKDPERGTYSLPTIRKTVAERINNARHQAETLFEFQNAAQILFADRVVLMEGKTERRLIPLIARLEGYIVPGEGSTALLPLDGGGSVPKALDVLSAMGIDARAVVDLDFAFRVAIRKGWIDRESEPVQCCLRILSDLESDGALELDNDGLPKKSSHGTAEDGFARLAQHEDAADPLATLHKQLKAHNIWMWQKGSLEHHLGIRGKSERTWAGYALELQEYGCRDVIEDYSGVTAFLEWACVPGTGVARRTAVAVGG